MRRSNRSRPRPPRHGDIAVTTMKVAHAKEHVRTIAASANAVRDYGGHESTTDSRGAFAPGGAAGANYETTSVNDDPDSDFSGTSR